MSCAPGLGRTAPKALNPNVGGFACLALCRQALPPNSPLSLQTRFARPPPDLSLTSSCCGSPDLLPLCVLPQVSARELGALQQQAVYRGLSEEISHLLRTVEPSGQY